MTDTPAVVCDLDGVVYRGREAIPESRSALERLREAGRPLLFATNNSSRTPSEVAEKIRSVVGFEVRVDEIATSAQAAANLVPPETTTCLVVGGRGIVEALEERGLKVQDSAEQAECVVVGLDRNITYEKIAAAATAVRRGAYFVATNLDSTFPTPSGLHPGAGSLVASIATASGRKPVVAGKPEIAMIELIRGRGVDEAWVIGDRMDTDIALASNAETWKSILVLTGVTSRDEDHSAADHVVEDLDQAVGLLLSGSDRQ